MMRIFQNYGTPSDQIDLQGDIDSINYLFLGNYVGKGTRSVETILLLLALKLKHHDQIHLVRGSMEDRKQGKYNGFMDECSEKFQEDSKDPNSIYEAICQVFDHLPIGALLEEKVFCVHGFIPSTVRSVEEYELIQRPVQ